MATPPEIQETRNIGGAQVALAAGGVLLLLVVLWFVFLRGGGDETLETAPTAPPVDAVPPLEPPEPVDPGNGKGPGKGPVETFEVFAPKDPFKPLVTAATGDAGDTGVDTDGDGIVDGNGNGNGGDGGGDDGGGDGNGGENVGGHRVSLVDVFRSDDGQSAQVQVDGTVYTVQEGDRFAESFQLLSINGDCATMLFGDDQFTLCEGEEILK